MRDKRDPWFELQGFLHPASQAPAVEVVLMPEESGVLGVIGCNSRVGVVKVEPAVNDD